MNEVRMGKYQHFKGNFYEVIGIAINSETLEELVVYRALYDRLDYGKNALWVRSKKNFLEKVSVAEKELPRFKYVGNF